MVVSQKTCIAVYASRKAQPSPRGIGLSLETPPKDPSKGLEFTPCGRACSS